MALLEFKSRPGLDEGIFESYVHLNIVVPDTGKEKIIMFYFLLLKLYKGWTISKANSSKTSLKIGRNCEHMNFFWHFFKITFSTSIISFTSFLKA